jgi:hypothetical protein
MPLALAAADVDSDGRPDLITESVSAVSVCLNVGFGLFEHGEPYSTAIGTCDVVAADFSQDRVPDVAVACSNANLAQVLLNDGLGGLRGPWSYLANASVIRTADFDNDCGPDFATTGPGYWVHVYMNQGGGTSWTLHEFQVTDPDHTGSACCVADLRDTSPPLCDIVVSYVITETTPPPEWCAETTLTEWRGVVLYSSICSKRFSDDSMVTAEAGIRVLHNQGGGQFNVSQPYPALTPYYPQCQLAAVDVDNDGFVDVCSTQRDSCVCVYFNDHNGGFSRRARFAAGLVPGKLDTGDFDRDGLTDLVLGDDASGSSAFISILRNSGGGFDLPVMLRADRGPVTPRTTDIDNDGDLDIVTANTNGPNGTVFLNSGTGSFAEPYYAYGLGPNGASLALADIDDDGDNDALVCDCRLDMSVNHLAVYLNPADSVPQSSCPWMTYPSEALHIGRAANSDVLNWVYQSNYGVFWRWRTTTGQVGPVTRLAAGRYPAIAEDIADRQMVVYSTGEGLDAMSRRIDGTWRQSVVVPATPFESVYAPSFVLSSPDFPATRTLGYAVYAVRDYEEPETRIEFVAFDSLGVYYDATLAVGDHSGLGAVSTPSIARTPGDYLNVAWCQNGEVCFLSTQEIVQVQLVLQGQFPPWCDVSYPSDGEEYAEPASHCFVEAQGEQVTVVWRGRNANGEDIGDVWRRRGVLQPPLSPLWDVRPLNQSNTPTQESDYPVMSTTDALAWVENVDGNQEIMAQVYTSPITNVSETDGKSDYPHTELFPPPPWPPGPARLFSLWTEELAPHTRYEVRFSDVLFPPMDAGGPSPCLNVKAGESLPSRYCLRRDGCDRTAQVHCDWSDSTLTYRLPYLHPLKHYYVEAVAYQNRSKETKQRVRLPNGRVWNLTLRKNMPETLRFVIPRGLYDSTILVVHIDRTSGSAAALASLKLYEFEVVEKGGDGKQSDGNTRLPLKPTLSAVYPNPFRANLAVRYQLPCAGRVTLKVYDMTGRLVKTLANGTEPPGSHVASFRGLDDKGRSLPSGVYLVRFTAPGVVDARRVVLAR